MVNIDPENVIISKLTRVDMLYHFIIFDSILQPEVEVTKEFIT